MRAESLLYKIIRSRSSDYISEKLFFKVQRELFNLLMGLLTGMLAKLLLNASFASWSVISFPIIVGNVVC